MFDRGYFFTIILDGKKVGRINWESVVKPEPFQQELFPDWANHMMHTTPVLGMALEMVLSDHRYRGAELGVLTTASVSMSYLVWICYIASVSGEWT